MVDNPVKKPAEPTRVEVAATKAEAWFRSLLAGSEVGAVRRMVLYGILGAVIVVFGGATLAGLIGIVALLLLIGTDRLV